MATPLPQSYQNKILALNNGQRAACIATLGAANIGFEYDGATSLWGSNNNAQAQTIIDTPGMWIAQARNIKTDALETIWATFANYDQLVRAGTNTTFTDANYLAVMAGGARKFRTLRAAIAAAATTDAVIAIDVASGWPPNP